jgi:hypothetical protein
MLVEYEAQKAHLVSVKLSSAKERRKFEKTAKGDNAIAAMLELGFHAEAKRVMLNTITMAMVSDCAHHIYEALSCFEKRKAVPAFNLLRKPLVDSLTYLSWMVANEDEFYTEFTSGDPIKITQKKIGNRRREIFNAAIKKTELADVINIDNIVSDIFDPGKGDGIYRYLQHAVHLVTVERIEIKTSPENFNFIFKHPFDDDVYEVLYSVLPAILLYMTHTIMTLYERVKPMDPGAKEALVFRTTNAYRFLCHDKGPALLADIMGRELSPRFKCGVCDTSLYVTEYNVTRLLLTDSFRCTKCRRLQPFPFSYMF